MIKEEKPKKYRVSIQSQNRVFSSQKEAQDYAIKIIQAGIFYLRIEDDTL